MIDIKRHFSEKSMLKVDASNTFTAYRPNLRFINYVITSNMSKVKLEIE